MDRASLVEIEKEKLEHYPVLQNQMQHYFPPCFERGTIIDATVGLGGHSKLLLQFFPHARLIAIDADAAMLRRARKNLASHSQRILFWHGWFDVFFRKAIHNYNNILAVFFDFGINQLHYEESGRGFSLHSDELLDMRLDASSEKSAQQLVNDLSERELGELFWHYSEERFSRRIAQRIVADRQRQYIATSAQLRESIYRAVPRQAHYRLRKQVASRCFQALRIAVNKELERLEAVLPLAFKALSNNGILACISFHSLEDRLVKNFFRSQVQLKNAALLHKKPLTADAAELSENRASRSAKLRLLRRKLEGAYAVD